MSIITDITVIVVVGIVLYFGPKWLYRLLRWKLGRGSSQRSTADRSTPETPTAESEGVQEYRSRMRAMADAEVRANANAEANSYRGQLRLVIRQAGVWSSQMRAMDDDRLLGARSYTRQQGRNAFEVSPRRIPALRVELEELVRHDKQNSTATSRQVIAMLAAKIVYALSLSADQVELAVVNHADRFTNLHGADGPGPDPIGPVGDVGSAGPAGSLPFYLDVDAVARREAELRSSSGGGDSHMAMGYTMASTAYNPTVQARSRHDMPGMRLPSPNRTAFSSAELFAQQRDMQRHDHGLQSVLVALHVAVSRIVGEPVALADYDYTINFAQTASVTTKRYSVRMRRPIEEQLDLVQRMEEATMTVRWTIIRNGTEPFFDPHQVPEMAFQDGHQPTGREQRVITLDDENK